MTVTERPLTRKELTQALIVAVMLIGMILLIIFMAANIITSISERNASAAKSAQTMGDVLTFPEGWEPVFCEADSYRTTGCNWICQSQVDSTYRYCSPTISTVEAPQ